MDITSCTESMQADNLDKRTHCATFSPVKVRNPSATSGYPAPAHPTRRQPLASFLSLRTVCPPELSKNETWFWVWFPLLSMIILKFFHVVVCVSVAPFPTLLGGVPLCGFATVYFAHSSIAFPVLGCHR